MVVPDPRRRRPWFFPGQAEEEVHTRMHLYEALRGQALAASDEADGALRGVAARHSALKAAAAREMLDQAAAAHEVGCRVRTVKGEAEACGQ
jgi:hypothetical protein